MTINWHPIDTKVTGRAIQESNYIPVIAEIGINHNGDLDVAMKLIEASADAGCDYVKFQKRSVDIVYSADFLDEPRSSPWGSTQRDQKMGLEFDATEYEMLKQHAISCGVGFTASAWDIPSLELVESLQPPFHKIPSAMMTHLDFLEVAATFDRPLVASTGMLSSAQLDAAVKILSRAKGPLVLLHSVSVYPCPEEHLNLSAISELASRYGFPVGYSGHESSLSPSLVAMALGAVMVERHVTLDRSWYGSDQAASLEMRGLRELVDIARKIPVFRGSGEKEYMPGELEVAAKLRYWEDGS